MWFHIYTYIYIYIYIYIHELECAPPIGGRLDHVSMIPPTSGLEPTLLKEFKMAEQEGPVICPECSQSFKTQKSERCHYTREHNKHLLLYVCEWCGLKYASSSALSRHATAKHPDLLLRQPLNVKLQLLAPVSPDDAETTDQPSKRVKMVTDPTKVRFRTIKGPDSNHPTTRPIFERISPAASPIAGPSTMTAAATHATTNTIDSVASTVNSADHAISFTTSPFNLSKFLCVPRNIKHPSGLPTNKSPSLNTSNPFRPWTSTPDLPVDTTPNTSDTTAALDLHTPITLTIPSPVIPSQWDTPLLPTSETPSRPLTTTIYPPTNPFIQNSPLSAPLTSSQHDVEETKTESWTYQPLFCYHIYS